MIRRKNSFKFIIIIVLILCISIGYAALNSTLTINGKSNISKNTWDIHFDNIVLKEGSVSTNVPVLSSNTITVETTLNTPGDYYGFTVDIVNSGTISAMIEDIEYVFNGDMNCANFLKVDIAYNDGADIDEKQFLMAGKTRTLNLDLEFLKDISASDLPQETTEISLSINIVYGQIDYNLENELHILHYKWNSKVGISLYDAINNKYNEMLSQNVTTYPRATEYTITAEATEGTYIIVGSNGKMLNLKNSYIDGAEKYKTTMYLVGTKINEERLYSEDYSTAFIDTTEYFGDYHGVVPVFVDQNDTYVNVAHALYWVGGAFTAPPANIEAMEQEVFFDYVLGIPAGQDTGCGGPAGSHRFVVFSDENGYRKITDKVVNLDQLTINITDISAEDMTWEEAKAYVIEMILSLL